MNDGQDPCPCPRCLALAGRLVLAARGESTCSVCQLELGWLANVPKFRKALELHASGKVAPRRAVSLRWVARDAIRVPSAGELTVGRSPELADYVIGDSAVGPAHCVVAARELAPDSFDYWLADLESESGTFVNEKPIGVSSLKSGDFVQLGEHAWTFNDSSGQLVPVQAVGGVALRLQSVESPRLAPFSVHVEPGEFVAVVGASGVGKSSLFKTIVGEPNARTRGKVWIGGEDIDRHPKECRRRLGYVPQDEIIRDDLTAEEAVQLSGGLRHTVNHSGPATSPDIVQVRQLFQELDVPDHCWGRRPKGMSGGERQRVRLAAELINNPGLLLLDEPAKGLDQDLVVALLRLLRNLSFRGCTVLVITHDLAHVDDFDRVLVVSEKAGRCALCFDGTPADLLAKRDFREIELRKFGSQVESSTAGDGGSHQAAATTSKQRNGKLGSTLREGFHQFQLLTLAETLCGCNATSGRILVPLLPVPAIFAGSIGLTVPAHDYDLLGFLSVVATIWMAASLSLTAIVGERTVFNHECLLALRITPYVLAKTMFLSILACVQCGVYLVFLSFIRTLAYNGDNPDFRCWWACLVFVASAAVALGLLLSAISRDEPAFANFLLALVIMAQITFSIQIAGRADAPLDVAYGEFNTQPCGGRDGCPRRTSYRVPQAGEFLCTKCRGLLKNGQTDGDLSRTAVKKTIRRQLALTPSPPESADEPLVVYFNSRRPQWWIAKVSYLTLSRPGDIALRSCSQSEVAQGDGNNHSTWRREALSAIFVHLILLPLLTIRVLQWQTTGRRYAGRQWLASAPGFNRLRRHAACESLGS